MILNSGSRSKFFLAKPKIQLGVHVTSGSSISFFGRIQTDNWENGCTSETRPLIAQASRLQVPLREGTISK